MIEYGKYILISKQTWETLKDNPKYQELLREIENKENEMSDIDENIAEEGMGNYLEDLEDYEEKLVRGEINWK